MSNLALSSRVPDDVPILVGARRRLAAITTPQRSLFALAALIITVLVGYAVLFLMSDRLARLEKAGIEAATLAQILEEHTIRIVQCP